MERYVETKMDPQVIGSFDTSQFGNLEIITVLQELRESKQFQMNYTTGGSIMASAAYDDGKIYFGSCDHSIYAVDAKTGKEVWRFRTKDVILCTPVVHNGIVYCGSHDKNLYAIDAETGSLKWRFPTKNWVMSSPVLHGSELYFGSLDNNLYALDIETGRELWRFRANGPIMLLPQKVCKGKLFFGSLDNKLYALDLKKRKPHWTFPTNGQIGSIPTFNDTMVYFGSLDGNIYGVDSETGKERWRFSTRDGNYGVLLHKDTLLVGSRDYHVYALSLEGKLKWKFKTDNLVVLNITADDEAVYFGSCDNNIYAVRLKDGKQLWKFPTQGLLIGTLPMPLHNGILYLGSFDCNMYALTTSGKLLWKFPTSMSSQSTIRVQSPQNISTFQAVWRAEETEKEKEKYQLQTMGSGESEYQVKSDYVASHKYTKKRKIKSMSSGWED